MFVHDVIGLAHLDPNADPEQPLPESAVVPLPYWLATPLALRRHVHVGLPDHYGARFRRHLDAAPASSVAPEGENQLALH
jgi:hypothetical protein